MIRGLEKIKTLEEYNLAKKDLEYCVSEYRWMLDLEDKSKSTKEPQEIVEEELKECTKRLRSGMAKDEEFDLLSKIHTLETKYISIVNGEYKPALKRNINGLILMMEQFEAANQNMKFGDLVKGILLGDKDVMEYLKKKYTFTLANMYGTAPAPESLNVESMDAIIDYMSKNYDFVDIKLESRGEEKSYLPVISKGEEIGLKQRVLERTEKEAEKIINRGEDIAGDKKVGNNIEENNKPRVHKDELPVPKVSGKKKDGGEFER